MFSNNLLNVIDFSPFFLWFLVLSIYFSSVLTAPSKLYTKKQILLNKILTPDSEHISSQAKQEASKQKN